MKTGTILRTFKARDGKEVTIRTTKWSDLDDLQKFINDLVEEDAMIARDSKVTRKAETDCLVERLKSLEKGRNIQIVADSAGTNNRQL